MAGTLKPDPAFQAFNTAKEKMGQYFRFTKRSALFNAVWMGMVPLAVTFIAYGRDGQFSFERQFRQERVLNDDYVPRVKDL